MNNVDIISNFLKNGDHNAMIARRTREIDELKKRFSSPDYKTTKNLQYEKLGKPLPYKWEDIFAEAESIRDEIHQREAEIENLLKLNEMPKSE